MSLRTALRRVAQRPVLGTLVCGVTVRVALVLHQWATNPVLRRPQLDAEYYLQWASEIALGDWAGLRGVQHASPFVLNPLYAYVLVPFVGIFANPMFFVALFQALLGAGAAALAAGAAVRAFGSLGGTDGGTDGRADGGTLGTRAAWIAGLLTVLSPPLAELDAHIAVAELSAFLIAGACFALSPPSGTDRKWAHGPVAAGLWLGIGALARPITPVALPLIAWGFLRRTGHGLRSAVLVVAVFCACAAPSLARNWVASGEPIVYTAAGGINAHLGNNPEARKFRGMTSPHFRFNPVTMHEDARSYVREGLGREPTWGEISSWFWKMALDDLLFRDPAGSAAFYLNKLRWFFGPTEVPSSASLATDLTFSPWLRVACAPTWLVASLALAGAWVHRKRRAVLFGAGALAFAHLAILTLVFPLSHYRAPAVPALAVLAGGAVAAAWGAWAAGVRRTTWTVAAIAGGAAVIGAVPPGPDPLWMRDQAILALNARDAGQLEEAEAYAMAAVEAYRRQWPEEPDNSIAWEMVGEMQFRRDKWAEARASLERSLALRPESPMVRLLNTYACERLGDFKAAESEAREVIRRYPDLPDGWTRLGEILSGLPGRTDEAQQVLREGIRRGGRPGEDALRRAGLIR